MVLRDEFLVKTDEVLRVDARHEFPAEVKRLGNGAVLVAALAQEAVFKDRREVKQLLVTLVQCVLTDDGDEMQDALEPAEAESDDEEEEEEEVKMA